MYNDTTYSTILQVEIDRDTIHNEIFPYLARWDFSPTMNKFIAANGFDCKNEHKGNTHIAFIDRM